MRSTDEEKQQQVGNLAAFRARHAEAAGPALHRLQDVARSGGNVFAELMETVKVASLHQITEALFQAGGRYRRGDAELYVSRGTGFWGPPMRLFAPAEITEHTLRKALPTAL